MLFYYVLETTAVQVLGTKIIDTTEKLIDNVDLSKSCVVVKVRGIRIKSIGSINKSKSQEHIADVEHKGCIYSIIICTSLCHIFHVIICSFLVIF